MTGTHVENSDVLLVGLVAVPVKKPVVPIGNMKLNVASPEPFVVALKIAVFSTIWPSPRPEGSHVALA